MTIKNLIERAGYYINLMPDKEDESQIIDQLTSIRRPSLSVPC